MMQQNYIDAHLKLQQVEELTTRLVGDEFEGFDVGFRRADEDEDGSVGGEGGGDVRAEGTEAVST